MLRFFLDIIRRMVLCLKQAVYAIEAAIGVATWVAGEVHARWAADPSMWSRWAWLPFASLVVWLFAKVQFDKFREHELKYLGHMSSEYDPRRDWKISVRTFTFASLTPHGMPPHWATGDHNKCVTEIIDTSDEPIEERSALHLFVMNMEDENSGYHYHLDDQSIDFIEFVGRFDDSALLAIKIPAIVPGKAKRYEVVSTLTLDLTGRILPTQVADHQWKIPAHTHALGNSWVSVMCDVRAAFNSTLRRQGYKYMGLRTIRISGECDISRVELYRSWWRVAFSAMERLSPTSLLTRD